MHTGKERLIVTNKNEIGPRYVCMYLYDIDMYTYMSRYGANKDLALLSLLSAKFTIRTMWMQGEFIYSS